MTILWVAHGGPDEGPPSFEGLGEGQAPREAVLEAKDVVSAAAALSRGDVGVMVVVLRAGDDLLSSLLPGTAEGAESAPPVVIVCASLTAAEEGALWGRGAFEICQGHPVGVASLAAALRRALRFRQTVLAFRRERAHLSSVLAHDLKNPLSAVLMTAHMLQGKLSEKDRPAVDRIRRAGQRMHRMIQEIVDFTHLRQGTPLTLRLNACDLGRLCRNAIEELGRAQPGLAVVFEDERAFPGTWDGERLEQLVIYVLSHGQVSGWAADGVVMNLETGASSEVTLTVSCRGSVLSPEDATRCLDPLGIDPRSAAARSGMGLYIARAIARAHGGELEMEATGERGTQVIVRLPRLKGPQPVPVA